MLRAAEQGRPDVKPKRDDWHAAQPALDPAPLVFVGETWASTTLARRYGRAPAGARPSGLVGSDLGRRPGQYRLQRDRAAGPDLR